MISRPSNRSCGRPQRHGIEVIWDLFHYGFPRMWICGARIFRSGLPIIALRPPVTPRARTDRTLYFTPVNEPSFMAFAAGERGLFAPHCTGRGWDLKVALDPRRDRRHRRHSLCAARRPDGECRSVMPGGPLPRASRNLTMRRMISTPAGVPVLGHAQRAAPSGTWRFARTSRYRRHQLLLD